ncbi:MAG: hypothetical protein PHW73_14870 [Atribacterota bacterium]|nr:hypothetical protein [Atribacterota bacterium]
MKSVNKAVVMVGGILSAGLGTWIVSLFPCLAAALFGSFVAHFVMYDKAKKKSPTPTFWVAWVTGILCASIVSWLNSLVPPFGCILSAFLGGVVMIIATFFKEELESVSEDSSAFVTPPPELRNRISGPWNAILNHGRN